MQISALEEYGVRCALQLAKHHAQGSLPASKIAEAEGLSVEYVGKIMHLFRKSGLVLASRGNQGGFYLADAPEHVSVHRVFEAMRSPKDNSTQFCERFSGQHEMCRHTGACSLRPVWKVLSGYFDDVLKSLTLADLARREDDATRRVSMVAAQKAGVLTQALRPSPSAGGPNT